MQTNKNLINGSKGLLRGRAVSLLIFAVVLILAVGGVLLHRKNHNKPAHYNSVTEASAALAKQELASQDYKSYQLRLSIDANDYIGKGEYNNAEKTLNEIVKTVPGDKITSQTYRAYWSLYEHKGDVQNRKKYALLTAQKLKAEGQADAAAAFEQDATAN